jgi:Cof subfamily protein (haloacid dehalogenase superfamily)
MSKISSVPFIAFDLDGTLLDSEGMIHQKDVELLRESSNINLRFIIATGRPLTSVKHTFHQNGLYWNEKVPHWLVLLNGALIFEAHEKLLAYTSLALEYQAEIIRTVSDFPQVTCMLQDISNIRVLNENEFGLVCARLWNFDLLPYDKGDENRDYAKIMCVSQSQDLLEKIRRRLSKYPIEMSYSMATVLEITPSGVNKGEGIKKLFELTEQNNHLLFAAGDGGNDIAMLQLAFKSYAPRRSRVSESIHIDKLIDVKQSGLLSPILDDVRYYTDLSKKFYE